MNKFGGGIEICKPHEITYLKEGADDPIVIHTAK